MERKAKIVATIGPASDSEEMLEALMRAGMNVARLNFSHGTHEDHARRIARIRQVAKKLGVSVGILQDLQGPKIRVGDLPAPLQLMPDQVVTLYAQEDAPPASQDVCIPVDFPELFESVHPQDRLLLDDGRLTLSVLSTREQTLRARVVVGEPDVQRDGGDAAGERVLDHLPIRDALFGQHVVLDEQRALVDVHRDRLETEVHDVGHGLHQSLERLHDERVGLGVQRCVRGRYGERPGEVARPLEPLGRGERRPSSRLCKRRDLFVRLEPVISRHALVTHVDRSPLQWCRGRSPSMPRAPAARARASV